MLMGDLISMKQLDLPVADQNMVIHFPKNLMIAGRLLQIMHFGTGLVSFDARSSR